MVCFTDRQPRSGWQPHPWLWPALAALVLSLTACDPGSGKPSSGSGKPNLDPALTEAELTAWVGTDDSELTLTSDISGPGTQLYTYNDPDCPVTVNARCSEQYLPTSSPFVVPSDPYLTLNQPGYAQLRHGDLQAETVLSARRFSGRSEHQTVYFKGQFWLVGGGPSDDLWSSVDGRHWVQHTSVNSDTSAGNLFAGRDGHQLVVFDAQEPDGAADQGEQLWLIGGYQDDVKNDVWSSSDGIKWTRHDGGERFTARRWHQVAVFDSNDDDQAELWLLGGNNGPISGQLGDLWTSTDGINWTQKTDLKNKDSEDAALFSAREEHQLVVFDAEDDDLGPQLWLIGGYRVDGYVNDVWSSPNGVEWTNHGNAIDSENDSAEAFTPRYGHRVIVFDAEGDTLGPQLWLVGGYDDNGPRNDVWSSTNGTHWTEHHPADSAANFFAPRYRHQLVVVDTDHNGHSELWLLAGDSSSVLNDTWSTRNGNDWEQQTPFADFSPRWGHQVVVFDAGDDQGEQFWMVGGSGGERSNEVWSSPDGVHWTQQPAVNSTAGQALFPARHGHQLVVFDGAEAPGEPDLGPQLWLIGGFSSGGDLNDVWSSPDGVSWTQQTLQCPSDCFDPRGSHQVVVFAPPAEADAESVQAPQLWLIGGLNTTAGLNDVWSSSDGINWVQQEAHNSKEGASDLFVPRSGHQVVVFDAGDDLGQQLWLIGGRGSDYNYLNDVWSSPDGLSWTQQQCTSCLTPHSYHQVVAFAADGGSEKLWLIGGLNGNHLNDLWSSPNGINWTKADAPGAFSGRSFHQVVVYGANQNDKQLWLIGGNATDGLSNQVWRSSNGLDWRLSVKSPLALPSSTQ